MNRTSVAAPLALFSIALANVACAGEFLEQSAAAVPGDYIVMLDKAPGARLETLSAPLRDALSRRRIGVTRVWNSISSMLVSGISREQARALAKVPGVAIVEPDYIGEPASVQYGATPGLDATDSPLGILNGTYVYNYTGANVTAYVIDTGVRTTHADFGGRASTLDDLVETPKLQTEPQDSKYPAGHGTGVASALGGATYGVAKQVKIKSIRAGSGAGVFSSTLITAFDDVLNDVNANHTRPAIVNISLDLNATSAALDAKVQQVVDAGIFVVAAAGNMSRDACLVSPQRVPGVFTVGFGDPLSNYGPCVDMYASGNGVERASYTSDTATWPNDKGSSFASPYTAGAAALILQQFPTLTPEQIAWELVARSTKGALPGNTGVTLGGAPNRWMNTLPLGYSTTPSVPSVLQRDTCAAGHYAAYWQPGAANASNLSTYFELQRSTSSTFASVTSSYVDGSFSNGYQDFASGTPLYFRVRSCNSRGCSAFKSSTPASCN